MRVRHYTADQNESLFAFIAHQFQELWVYRFALKNIVTSTIEQQHRRSILGFLWSFLDPLFHLIILAIVFSILFNQDLKDNAMYIFSGILTWNFISSGINSASFSLLNAESYLKKIYVPKVLFVLANLLVTAVNMLFSLACYITLGVFIGFPFGETLWFLPLTLALTLIFLFGISLIVAILNIYFRDLAHIISVLLSGLVWLAPVMYRINSIPDEYKNLFVFNPLYSFITIVRDALYFNQYPSALEWCTATLIALVSLFLGLWLLRKYDKVLIYIL